MVSPTNLVICGASEYQVLLAVCCLERAETTSPIIARNMVVWLNLYLVGVDLQLAKGNHQTVRPMMLKIGWLGDGTINDLQKMLSVESRLGVERFRG